ncbi:MAG TPA: LysM peptidoglycan-binding domain-containing protein [Kofleriaceae bacterium]|nr:LysM peptidoglycan-binding domain-containing protein [Kofleriaceae bacterium]
MTVCRAARAPCACAVALRLGLGATLLAAPAVADAQTPIHPNAPEAPTVLSPGASGNQAPPAPQPRAPNPGVVLVGPDGKAFGDTPAGGGTYYVPPSGGPGGPGGDVYEGPDVAYSGPVPELHVVRNGDTLWDICWFYFNDPWQWPKIWSYNAQITNPHWIYPGDLVRLLPRGVFSQVQPAPDPEGGRTAPRPPDPVPAPQRRIDSSVTTTAFVEKSDLERSITIEGAVDEKVLLGVGDDVYLSYPKDRPPEVGKRYSIYVPGRAVKSGTSEYGSYVRLLGTLQVVSVKDGKRARGQIVEANQEIERGAKVGPLVTKFRNVPPVAPKVDLQGTIVAILTRDQMIGDKGEVVFVALGKGSGLEVGNRMYVVRRGDAYPDRMRTQIGSDDRRFPARALGEIVIVEVGDKVSIGVVTLGVQEMSIGDLVMMQRST